MQLQLEHVSKQYRGGVWALRDFSLHLGPGIVGLLGPNGAGKSTVMRMIATITQPTSGAIAWNGADIARQPDALRRVLGYLPQDFGVYPNLNAVEFLSYLAAVKGLERKQARRRIDELLQLLNLSEVAYRPIGGFSGGMRQRVGIAQALLNDPHLLIVDEPTVGLDPEERARFRNLIADLAGERIVMLSTHIVSDVEATATSIALIAGGRLLRHALPEELLQAVAGKVWGWLLPSDALTAVRQTHRVVNIVRRPDGALARIVSDSPPHPDAAALPPSLEDAYLYCVAQRPETTV
ncbi:ABC transporter ATP-binding protein [Candidatus Chloroploca asiatica]|uniref:ABC transporter ATP-binding protein n=1 Tax=Candidatus Chloroploca asiatica TaxID=1506545 RepID=A0A2H3KPU9_9CHLR|nr:ABC transporter ATP-binding protein [Candidatus Chloroploca asiatica]